MHAEPVAVLVNHVRRLVGTAPQREATDHALLRRFAGSRDEAAFEALVRRHGPMVLRVCRRALPNTADAEDVFQATFLVLARKAASERWHDSVANWLFGVARRLAHKARERAARRTAHEARATVRPAVDPLAEITGRELLGVLDEELLRLPDRYREPLVLCYLQGLTRDEAAQRLGCPLGTLKDRLGRGRDLLGRALARRGVGLGAALAASLAVAGPGGAAVPLALLRTTLHGLGAGGSPAVRALVEGATAPAGAAKAKAVVVLMLAGLVAAGAALGARQKPKADPPPPAAEAPPAREPAPAIDALGDPLPPGALMRLGTCRHRVLAWLGMPDGKSYLALQSGEIRRLDAVTGRVLETSPVPDRHHVVGFSPDGRHVLLTTRFIFYTGARFLDQAEKQEWVLSLYDLERRKAVWTKSEQLEEKDWKSVDLARFSADGKWIATGGRLGGVLRLWDGTTGKELWHHVQDNPGLSPLGFIDGDRTLVLWAANDNTIHLFDRTTGKSGRSFSTLLATESQHPVLAPDGSAVMFGRYGPTVRVWDLATGKERAPLDGHKGWARSVAFSRDGKTVVTGGNDPFVLVRDWPSGKVIRTIETGRERAVSAMEVSGDGRRLEVLFWGEQALHFFDLATGQAVPALVESHRACVYGVAAAPDGALLSFGRDGTVRTWDLAARKAVGVLPVAQDLNAGGLALSRDGRLLAVSNFDENAVCLYERATGKLVRKLPTERGEGNELAFSPDGRWLSGVGSSHGIIRVWDVSGGRTVLHLKYQSVSYSLACAFSPEGRRFAAAEHGVVRFWDTATWGEQSTLEAFAPMGLAFSPDGRTLATASVEGIRLFELATHRERVHIRPRGCPCGLLRFSPTGRWLAWQNDRTTIHVWDVRRGELVGPFAGHDAPVTGLAFTADDRALASSSDDSTILVWDVAGSASTKAPAAVADFDRAWQALAGDDAKAAYTAMRELTFSPDAVKGIGARLRPAAPLDPKRTEACLRDLDSEEFAVRERAARELEQMGDRAVPALEQFLTGTASLEAKRHVREVLDKLRGLVHDSEQLRALRALEVLERAGDDEVRRVLRALAAGAPAARQTREAKAALERLSKE
jgi:RNA polymerase sigma factor (sigma-70 family)